MYTYREGSITEHCCFQGSIIDKSGNCIAEVFDIEIAKKIIEALNNLEDDERKVY